MNTRDAYLLDALVLLAATFPEPLTVAEIARRRGIPAPFLGRLLAAAARRGAVLTSRGPGGGVRLARPPAEITLDALLAPPSPPRRGGIAVHRLASELADARAAVLASTTLADLLAHERRAVENLSWSI